MELAAGVTRYLEISGRFGHRVHLSEFGLSKAEIERTFSAWDEDYQISRYMRLSRGSEQELAAIPSDSRVFLINGFEVSHVIFREEIKSML